MLHTFSGTILTVNSDDSASTPTTSLTMTPLMTPASNTWQLKYEQISIFDKNKRK